MQLRLCNRKQNYTLGMNVADVWARTHNEILLNGTFVYALGKDKME